MALKIQELNNRQKLAGLYDKYTITEIAERLGCSTTTVHSRLISHGITILRQGPLRKDLTGQKFNRLTVLGFSERTSSRHSLWDCICECGNKTTVTAFNLKNGRVKSCGCLKTQIEDLTGQKFNRLTAIHFAGRTTSRRSLWDCICECGNKTTVTAFNLKNGGTKSCGCLRVKDLTGKKFGRLTVLNFVGKNKKAEAGWKCQCECGNTVIVAGFSLSKGRTRSCGCLRIEDLSGQTFGALTVLTLEPSTLINYTLWNCKCECGTIRIYTSQQLKQNKTLSCGCLNHPTDNNQHPASRIEIKQALYLRKLKKQRLGTKNLSSAYIKKTLTKRSFLTSEDIPPELVELQLLRLKLIREVKNEKDGH